ncbi:MAG: methylated-DNA--[protein]-cysteine S-methyltransferase [Acidimicrobiales bacterium]
MKLFRLNVNSPVGVWGVEGNDLGVTRIFLPHERGRASTGRAPACVRDAARQLEEYFAGTRRHFDVRLSPVVATAFQNDVWSTLSAIPYGQVRTYSQVASAVKRPRAMRAVGNANHANPWPVIVPCHRVVAKDGLGGYGGGEPVKRYLLELEGASLV